jgi:hypothetical protein
MAEAVIGRTVVIEEGAIGDDVALANEAPRSGVTWSAILAGAAGATAVSVALLLLGSALGFASMSPWPGWGASATAIGVGAAIWLIVVQWLASALGGYLAGRLRTKWVGVHTDEVFFRDTAHGFLAWAVATLAVVGLAAMVGGAVAGRATDAAATVASGAAQGAAQGAAEDGVSLGDPTGYYVDTLFRSDTPPTTAAGAGEATAQDMRGEASRILGRALVDGQLVEGDRTRLAQLIAARTGMSQADAEKRVDEVMAQAKAAADQARAAADEARKAAAKAALFGFLSLAIGAFIASAAAAYGGRLRDDAEHVV